MGRRIVIEDVSNKDSRQRVVNNKFFEWLLYMVSYSIVLIVVSLLFGDSFYISNKFYGLYALLASIIIYILNQTIKPVLVFLTLPITALSMGLFYPLINVFILYITSFILGDNFNIEGIFIPFVIAIFISFLNMVMEGMIIKPIIYRSRDYNE